jgi:hypothetical protein
MFTPQNSGKFLLSAWYSCCLFTRRGLIPEIETSAWSAWCQIKLKGRKTMNGTFRSLSALAGAFSMSLAAAPAYSEGKGKTKPGGKQDAEVSGKHGREAGGLPYGLEEFSGRKGSLPSRLQKKKDQDGSLTGGLRQGGKKSGPGSKAKKGNNRAG